MPARYCRGRRAVPLQNGFAKWIKSKNQMPNGVRNSRLSNSRYAASAAPNRRSVARTGIAMMPEFIAAYAAVLHCSTPRPNLIPARGGRVSGGRINPRMSCHAPTSATACNAWRCFASNVARISGISSRTARRPPGCASASTQPRLRWTGVDGYRYAQPILRLTTIHHHEITVRPVSHHPVLHRLQGI